MAVTAEIVKAVNINKTQTKIKARFVYEGGEEIKGWISQSTQILTDLENHRLGMELILSEEVV